MNIYDNGGNQSILGWNYDGCPEFIRKVGTIVPGGLSKRTKAKNGQFNGKIAQKFASELMALYENNAGGFMTNDTIGCQWKSATHAGSMVLLYDKNTKKAKACYVDDADDSIKPYKTEYGKKIFGLLMHFLAQHDAEYLSSVEDFFNEVDKIKDPASEVLSQDGAKALAIASDSAYRQSIEEAATYFRCEIDNLDSIPTISPSELNISGTVTYSIGDTSLFSFQNNTATATPEEELSIEPGAYDLGNREFSDTEKAMMDASKLPDSIIISKEAAEIAQCISETSNDPIPARTFLFSGPAGNGKSTTAQCVASLINRPFIRQSLGPDSDKFDLLSATQPNTNKAASFSEDDVCREAGIPTFVELQFDVVSAYLALTGILPVMEGESVRVGDSVVSKEDFVYLCTEKWKDKYNEAVAKYKGGNESDFIFVDSPIIQAAKYGWVCEIQEPTLVMNSGELGLLNALLEEGVAYLPSGEMIRRHPDNVVIFTTNYGYEGCNALNQALRDRCRKEITFEMPSEEVLVERTMQRSGNTDRQMVTNMVKFMNSIREFCKRQMIGDGEIGERSLINWAADVAHGHSPYKVAIENVINKAASDPEERATLVDFLNNSTFKETRRKTR